VLPRLFTIAIIGFWLVMSGLLLRSIWFPADSRLAVVNPGAVFQLIAARGESSELDIYDDRRIVGNLSISAGPSGDNTKLGINGRLNLDSGLLPGTSLDLNSQTFLDHGGNTLSFHLTLTTQQPKLNLIISQPSPEASPFLVLMKDGTALFDSSKAGPGQPEGNPFVALLLGTLGMSYTDFQAMRQDATAAAGTIQVEARQGKFELGNSTKQGFILKIGAPGKPGFRMCVENTGEIVRLETPVSYHLMTESLRPDSAPVP
jgi:hypothetical protein